MSIGQSFSIAAWVVLIGVVSAWLYLNQGSNQNTAALPEIPTFTLTTMQDVAALNWVERAESAFAAGRITRPEGDSALFFYQKMLLREPSNEPAKKGLKRVVGYLIQNAESALRQADLTAARDLAGQALQIEANNRAASSVVSRVSRLATIRELSEQAIAQMSAGNLTTPKNNNALQTYREILVHDPANPSALLGIESVAQRLATIAQTEAFAENHERAKKLIALAKEIAPNATGIAETEKLTLQWTDMVKDQAVKEDLLAATQALQEGFLVGVDSPEGFGALDYYRSALKKNPQSQAAVAGVRLVIDGLVERGWKFARADQIEAVRLMLDQAREAGAQAYQLEGLSKESAFLDRRARARAGYFEDVTAIRELSVRRQGSPVLPRNISRGWIELLFTVTEKGDVTDIQVVEASEVALEKPATTAVERWRFDPFLDEGRPIAVRSGVRFTFQS
ncbi:MAG: TonB family protein [Gammaproteobacteria bacterium]|nr:TonB family protein [Gammaproteobacteria bacterium]